MFKLENSPDSVDQELDSDLLAVDPSYNPKVLDDLFYNEPCIIESLSDTLSRQTSFPVSPIGPPDRYPLNNESQFVVQINSSEVKRKKYLYSHKLNRIYVDIETCFCIEFNWNQKMFTHSGPMYVRSVVVFSDMAQAQKRVEVCVQHYHTAKSAGKPDLEAKNVLLSARSGTDGVYYCGVPERPDSWLSVLVEFNKTSDEPCLHAYQFVCKNSCSTGINRRSIEIIFTLEDKRYVPCVSHQYK
ncbi:hypothetical protein O3G_MSEX013577 [Manduca sexta]|uniref:p53 DNA-binding domain-containing protein n=1 Tax=Manduca sexta TaxID=7130 RepID=A0A921ZS31_MANSE|nr:hypothetical protein O3G_MSEX013577 [Manduca sexta]KAG6462976.1 hypothetical protein O3G_MSEX013577 [Manduca sexta]